MLNTYIPARSLQKSYKAIIGNVKAKKEPVILTTNHQPQAALVSLEDLENLQQAKAVDASQKLLQLAREARNELKGLPANLRKQANKILYER